MYLSKPYTLTLQTFFGSVCNTLLALSGHVNRLVDSLIPVILIQWRSSPSAPPVLLLNGRFDWTYSTGWTCSSCSSCYFGWSHCELRNTWLVESHWVTEFCRLSSSGWLVPLSEEFSWHPSGLAIVTMCLNVELCYWIAVQNATQTNLSFELYLPFNLTITERNKWVSQHD